MPGMSYLYRGIHHQRRDLCLLIDLRPSSDPADKVLVSVLCSFFFFFVTSRILSTQWKWTVQRI